MNVYGTSFNYPFGTITDASGVLTGILSDGSAINNQFFRNEPPAILNLIFLPEPATVGMFGMAMLVMLRRRS